MTKRALFAVCAGACAVACGSEGYTPACPELLPFDVRDEVERVDPEVVRARADAVEAGCLTAPGAVELGGSAGDGAESAGDGGRGP